MAKFLQFLLPGKRRERLCALDRGCVEVHDKEPLCAFSVWLPGKPHKERHRGLEVGQQAKWEDGDHGRGVSEGAYEGEEGYHDRGQEPLVRGDDDDLVLQEERAEELEDRLYREDVEEDGPPELLQELALLLANGPCHLKGHFARLREVP